MIKLDKNKMITLENNSLKIVNNVLEEIEINLQEIETKNIDIILYNLIERKEITKKDFSRCKKLIENYKKR